MTTHEYHLHSAQWYEDRPFNGPVAFGDKEVRGAHGNIVRVAYCSCGATRRTNLNGPFVEVGEWTKATGGEK